MIGIGLDEGPWVLTIVLGLVFSGWDVADLAVETALVEPVDISGDGDLDVGDRSPGPFIADELGLK